jgi:hypothetical protein
MLTVTLQFASVHYEPKHAITTTANVVPSLPTFVTLMMEEILSSETSVLARATRRRISEDGILLNLTEAFSGFIQSLQANPSLMHSITLWQFSIISLDAKWTEMHTTRLNKQFHE